jgi:hypothetical protein
VSSHALFVTAFLFISFLTGSCSIQVRQLGPRQIFDQFYPSSNSPGFHPSIFGSRSFAISEIIFGHQSKGKGGKSSSQKLQK